MTTQRYVPPVTETANELAEREGSTQRAEAPAAPPTPQTTRRKRVGVAGWICRVPHWAVLIGFALLFLYPFAWLLAASFKPRGEVFDNRLIPKTFQPENFVKVFSELPLLNWIGNSLYIAILAAGFVAVSSSIVAFGFAYFKFPGRSLLFGLVLATMMLPGAV